MGIEKYLFLESVYRKLDKLVASAPLGILPCHAWFDCFGKVIAGMDVVDEIANQETDKGEWPKKNIMIRKVEILE